ncbi:MAG: hypothetical protein AAF974_03275 [Cyanobacteria bacterium P01_E01_bin.34]
MPTISLYLSIILVSLHQSLILSFGHFGQELLGTSIADGFDREIPHQVVYEFMRQLDADVLIQNIMQSFIALACIQLALTVGYSLFRNQKRRRWFAIALWVGPGLSLHVLYLLSPLLALIYWPEFHLLGWNSSSVTSKEMFGEGWMFQIAALGWFHIFWLTLVIKSVFFPSKSNARQPQH